jgi:hypothetical protein
VEPPLCSTIEVGAAVGRAAWAGARKTTIACGSHIRNRRPSLYELQERPVAHTISSQTSHAASCQPEICTGLVMSAGLKLKTLL